VMFGDTVSWFGHKNLLRWNSVCHKKGKFISHHINKVSHQWGIWYWFCLNNLTVSHLISVVIHMHPCKCSLVKCILALDLMVFIKLYSCSQGKVLPNTDDINKACFLMSGNIFHNAGWLTKLTN
jgi:hypothetical protein